MTPPPVETREQVVTELTVQGHSLREIEDILGISRTTAARDLAWAKRLYMTGLFVPVTGSRVPKDWENEKAAGTFVPKPPVKLPVATKTGRPSLDAVVAVVRDRLGPAAISEAVARALDTLETDLKRMLAELDA